MTYPPDPWLVPPSPGIGRSNKTRLKLLRFNGELVRLLGTLYLNAVKSSVQVRDITYLR